MRPILPSISPPPSSFISLCLCYVSVPVSPIFFLFLPVSLERGGGPAPVHRAAVDAFQADLKDHLKDHPAELTRGVPEMIEVLPHGASKAVGLAALLRELGISPDEVCVTLSTYHLRAQIGCIQRLMETIHVKTESSEEDWENALLRYCTWNVCVCVCARCAISLFLLPTNAAPRPLVVAVVDPASCRGGGVMLAERCGSWPGWTLNPKLSFRL